MNRSALPSMWQWLILILTTPMLGVSIALMFWMTLLMIHGYVLP